MDEFTQYKIDNHLFDYDDMERLQNAIDQQIDMVVSGYLGILEDLGDFETFSNVTRINKGQG